MSRPWTIYRPQQWDRAGVARMSKSGQAVMIYLENDEVLCIKTRHLESLLRGNYKTATVTRPPAQDLRGDNL